ncbi:hypothetical protein BDF19DRAFT_442586 [Syncephalis fuscata]|nr:hypothetical protein BDF19DRAFT_442586 [Syncephalis fuscata]
MSTPNNDTLPKTWLAVEIIHHISQFTKISATLALARTCKLLYNYIIKCDWFWQKLYRQHFPRDIDTGTDWLQWQLEQERREAKKVVDTENEIASRLTWFKRYGRRVEMGLNWQKNKSTSAVYPNSFMLGRPERRGINHGVVTASCPGWIAIADCDHSFIDLIKLSTKDEMEVQSLNLDKNCFNRIKKIAFCQCQQVDDTDEYMRVIIHLKYSKRPFDALQIWNANSCQLLGSLLFSSSINMDLSNNSQLICRTQLAYNIDSAVQPYEPQFITLPNADSFYANRIHTTDNNSTVIMRCRYSEYKLDYQIIRMLLKPDTGLTMNGDDTARATTIVSDCITFSNFTDHWSSVLYSIDRDRILIIAILSYNTYSQKRYIRVISLSKGIVFECNYPIEHYEELILISAYNLAVFHSIKQPSLVFISLLNGEILHEVDVNLTKNYYKFQHIIDTKIFCYAYPIKRYCVVDAVTGDTNMHQFPISEIYSCKSVFGHLLSKNNGNYLITSFVPELV